MSSVQFVPQPERRADLIIEVCKTDSRSLLEWRYGLYALDATYTGCASGQYAIASIGIMHDHAKGVDVHDGVKSCSFEHHFTV